MRVKIPTKFEVKIPYKLKSNIVVEDNDRVLSMRHIGSQIFVHENSVIQNISKQRSTFHLVRNIPPRYFFTYSYNQKIVSIPLGVYSKAQLLDDTPVMVATMGTNTFIDSIFGIYVNRTRVVRFDFDTLSITAESITKNFSSDSVLEDTFLEFYGWLNNGHMIITSNAILKFGFNPIKETIINPLDSHYYKEIQYYLDYVDPTATYFDLRTQREGVMPTVRIRKPVFLFSGDGVDWYKWNTGTTVFDVQSPDNTEYFIMSEFLTKGNSYDEYLSIPDAGWTTQFGSGKIYFLINDFVPPIYIHTNVLLEDDTEFLSFGRDNTNYYILKGDV